MVCYLDQTFCPYWKTCLDGPECAIKLTKETIQKARAFGLPVCRYAAKPGCHSIRGFRNTRKVFFK